MREAQEKRYRVIAALLQYPDPSWLEMIPEVNAYIGRLPAGRTREIFEEFLDYLSSQPLLRLQENYTAAFDLNPATTLNMSYHLSGDGRKRAALLALLQQNYHCAGYEGAVNDLPDFLPAMLEFMAVCRDPEVLDPFRQCMAGLEGLAHRLHETAPAYAHLLKLLDEDCRRREKNPGPPSRPNPAGCVESTPSGPPARACRNWREAP